MYITHLFIRNATLLTDSHDPSWTCEENHATFKTLMIKNEGTNVKFAVYTILIDISG